MTEVEKKVDRIDELIALLKWKYDNNAKGTETEVYTRIVGYYRPLKNWNPGKAEEYKDRLLFTGLEEDSTVTKRVQL